jgi:hypothetical protein
VVAVLVAACGGPPEDTREGAGSAPTAELIPRGTAGLHAVLPSVVLLGEPADLRVAPLTDLGTPDGEWSGDLEMESTDTGLVAFAPFEQVTPASWRRSVVFRTPGLQRITVRSGSLETVAGPVRVVRTEEELRARAGAPARRIYWGDAHGHTDLGDGTGTPPSYLLYAREFSHLDYVCLSEHDFQQFLEVGFDEQPAGWDSVATLAAEWRRPGFAVLLGWEWSSREHGHRVVLFPDDESRYVSFRRVGTPAGLAEALAGTGAFSVLAHPSGSRLTPEIRWDTVVPGFDRVVEIYSGHGSMDESDYRPTSEPAPGHGAIESLRRGIPLGFAAFSDTHLSTPGNPWPPELRDSPWPGGLTAVIATGPSEREIHRALGAGRCYATSGPRFLVDVTLDGAGPGEALELPRGGHARLRGIVAAPRILESVEILFGLDPERRLAGGGPQMEIDLTLGPFDEDTPVWLAGRSADDERFWTTPVWVRVP